ncbi:phosphopantetheine-binding protein [Streptomyces sp. ME19-01-6]|uniref:phosphopantetheine-binding protein n=1 Tax=Streptomyces sp. ME19-01-6 TaxID=3028686 RepID=UPI0029B59543|nr:phosphopantetheine-binding protein [Streptomyces sp. ME19-01-6]MDX3229773.1 phosphopantetheine-binding protein [Streptomyces sp. ME19-01-6]
MHSDRSIPWERQFEGLVLGVLPQHSRHAPLDPGLDLKTAGLDSMATVELLVRLEEAYGVDFPDAALSGETFATPAALWRVLTAQRAAPAPAPAPAPGEEPTCAS